MDGCSATRTSDPDIFNWQLVNGRQGVFPLDIVLSVEPWVSVHETGSEKTGAVVLHRVTVTVLEDAMHGASVVQEVLA